jgi:thioredoxin reductase
MATLHDDFEHEMVDGELAMAEIEALRVQGVPAVFDGRELVSSGKSNLADLLAELEGRFGRDASGALPRADLGEYDVAVVGGGPAGAASAIYTARKGLRTVVITDRLGGQLQDTRAIENLVSVTYTEGPKLSADLGAHLAAYDIELLEHRRVARVEPGEPVVVTLDSGEELRTRALIVATGAKWRELGVEGEKEYLGRGVAFCPHCDGPYYRGKDIAVVGGGNSGVEAAIDLAGIVRSVTVFELMPELKADAVLVEKLRSLENARIVENARTTRVVGDGTGVTALEYESSSRGSSSRSGSSRTAASSARSCRPTPTARSSWTRSVGPASAGSTRPATSPTCPTSRSSSRSARGRRPGSPPSRTRWSRDRVGERSRRAWCRIGACRSSPASPTTRLPREPLPTSRTACSARRSPPSTTWTRRGCRRRCPR